jgi:hypothetical protein
MMKDPATQQFVLNAGNARKDFDLQRDAYVFTACVVKKIEKS